MSYETNYAAWKRQQLDALTNTPEAVEERIQRRIILEKIREEVAERFPTITAENIGDALAYQDSRIEEEYGKLEKAFIARRKNNA